MSEIRSTEIRYLLETLSTGASGITTIHTDDVRNIPERMKNMAGGQEDLKRIENDTYRYLDVGILVKKIRGEDGKILRRIEQIALFERYARGWEETINQIIMLMEDGNPVDCNLPHHISERFREEGIVLPSGGGV